MATICMHSARELGSKRERRKESKGDLGKAISNTCTPPAHPPTTQERARCRAAPQAREANKHTFEHPAPSRSRCGPLVPARAPLSARSNITCFHLELSHLVLSPVLFLKLIASFLLSLPKIGCYRETESKKESAYEREGGRARQGTGRCG